MLKMGQKLKDPNQYQTVGVFVSLTEAEAEKLDQERGSTPRATFLRNLYLKGVIVHDSHTNKKAYSELARTAANLNQIAKKLNSGDRVSAESIRNELMRFRNKLRGFKNESHE